MHDRNVIITGLPRSGTTLTCELLSEAPNTIALDEPMGGGPWTGVKTYRDMNNAVSRAIFRLRQRDGRQRSKPFDLTRFLGVLDRFFADTRRSLLTTREAYTGNVGGSVSGGKFADDISESGLRRRALQRSVVRFDKDLTDDFVLAIKHNAGFTAVLEHLTGRYPVFAIVRNPLSILSSWQTVPVPANRGRVPRGEQADPALRERLDATDDVLDRQFILLDWFFGKYRQHLDPEHVIRYEDIVASNAAALAVISPYATEIKRELHSRNKADVYDADAMRRLADRLAGTDGPWLDYYDADSFHRLAR